MIIWTFFCFGDNKHDMTSKLLFYWCLRVLKAIYVTWDNCFIFFLQLQCVKCESLKKLNLGI